MRTFIDDLSDEERIQHRGTFAVGAGGSNFAASAGSRHSGFDLVCSAVVRRDGHICPVRKTAYAPLGLAAAVARLTVPLDRRSMASITLGDS
jgi:hypothetical protein